MTSTHYGMAYQRDSETDALIDIEIRVIVPFGYDIVPGELDEVADDAVESILVKSLYELRGDDAD